jgi:serine O-acetyltransferase
MDRVTKADLYRHDGLSGTKGFIKGLFDLGFRYIYIERKVMKYRSNTVMSLFFKIIKRLFTYREYQISNEAEIGEGFYLYHRGLVIIGPIKIGKNCCVSHNVTIGRSNRGGVLGRPTLGDNVWIGPGSVIVGKVNIGNNILIAPNSFINFDVPDNSIVIGCPGKIIRKDNPTKHYINFVLPD